MKITMVAATAAVGVLALVGCSSSGGDGSETSGANDNTTATTMPSGDREELVRAMVSEGATEEVANCFIDEVGVDGTKRIRASEDSELSESDMTTIERALQKCDPELLGAGTTAP